MRLPVILVMLMMLMALPSGAVSLPLERGKLIERVSAESDPTQTYALYVPTGYVEGTKLPVLLIFDPRGRAIVAAELFRAAADEYGWLLVSSNDTRSDGPWEPNERALKALWPEVNERLPIDRRRVYATGFSGGAFVAWALAVTTDGVAGVIACGGHLSNHLESIEKKPIPFAWYGIVGDIDFNNSAMRAIDSRLDSTGSRHRLDGFEGGHQWPSPGEAGRALGWMEIEAMRSGSRPADRSRVERFLAEDLTRAEQLESQGEILIAHRLREAALRTIDGLIDSQALKILVEAARKSRRVREAEAEERRWDAHEISYLRDLNAVMSRIENGEAVPGKRLLGELGVARLQKRAAQGGEEGREARRVLEGVFSRTSFYTARELEEKKRWRELADSLRVALEIKPEAWWVRYELAGALARQGDAKQALAELGQAAASGKITAKQILGNTAFAGLAGHEGFRQILSSLEAKK